MTSWWLRPPADDGDTEPQVAPDEAQEQDRAEDEEGADSATSRKRTRRRARRRTQSPEEEAPTPSAEEPADEGGSKAPPRRRRASRKGGDAEAREEPEPAATEGAEEETAPKTRARRRGGSRRAAEDGETETGDRPGRQEPQGETMKDKDRRKESAETAEDRLRWREGDEVPTTFHQILQETEMPVATSSPSPGRERRLALFCDLENIALGVRDSRVESFEIGRVLERLLEKGRIIVKKAYCDWQRYSEYKRPFHEAAVELIDIPQKRYSGKNSADIKMVVDAMDLCYSKEHLDTFVILSGDSDFSPLVSKLRENNKFVIGVGVKNSTSELLINNCDEFIYYEDVWRDVQKSPKLDGLEKKQSEVFALMIDAILALLRDNRDVLWGSMIKQTMQRKRPSFSESYYGYSSFSELLEDAEKKKMIRLRRDPRSGTYVVTGFAGRG